MPRISLKDCVVQMNDNDSNSLIVKIGEGNFTWTETRDRKYFLDRGHIDSVRDGDDVPVDIKMDFAFEFLKSSSGPVSVREALTQTGGAANWVSTDPDLCNPYCVDIVIRYTPPCVSQQDEIYYFAEFRYEKLDFDPKTASVSVTGKANITQPNITRVAHS